jgi:UDP-N-acetylglucosamine--N-acetylmuramyl-(pentapeptide) pyrophosphoryl-undecaprenol N-acetylglucosamine transferase
MPEAPRGPVVCLTGGGTAGHVWPHFALLPTLTARGWRAFYIGGTGMERGLVTAEGLEYHAIASGKLRRYLSLQNLLDLFKVFWGTLEALWVLARKRPDVVFSKGGFVAVPVAVAAWLLRIPVVSHESDVTPGLANRLIKPFSRQLLYTFPETAKHLGGAAEHVGTPIRPALLAGDAKRGEALCGFAPEPGVPTVLVMGGSQGAARLNEALARILPWLTSWARVVHLTGQGKDLGLSGPRYKAFEFVREEMPHLMALADLAVTRAGANSIFELLALAKPMLLVPLEVGSRGDQVVNAASFTRNGWAMTLRETELTEATLEDALTRLRDGADEMRTKQRAADVKGAAERIAAALARAAGRPS